MVSRSCAFAVTVLWGLLFIEPTTAAQSAGADQSACPVTQPNGRVFDDRSMRNNYGNDALVTQLWSDGTVVFSPGGPGFVLEDGALSMKFPWFRLRKGPLTIEGRRLDGDAPLLRAHLPCCYGATGFQVTALIFPTPGCWEVTGRVGDGSLTFVTRVEKIGDGPTRRLTP